MNGNKIFYALILAGIISLFPNINLYEFRGEESLRVIVAYEMQDSGDYLQPHFLGDLYFNKPPLFNWLIVASSKFIPWSELTARIVTIFSLFLTVLLIYFFSQKLFQNKKLSLLAGLIYITFIDILFWYGYLAEIDVTLAFFVFLMFILQYVGYFERKAYLILLSGLVAGLAFLLKGFPAYVFWGLTFITFIIYKKNWKDLINPYLWTSGIIALLVPALWILNTDNPNLYLQKLLIESLIRTKGSSNILKLFGHFLTYPLLNFKQLLPASFIILLILIMAYRRKIKVVIPSEIKILLLTAFINYIPYFLAVHSRGRYIIPLFPIIAIIFAYLIVNTGKEKWIKITVWTASILIALRFLLGFVGFPILMEKKASRKRVAYNIAETIDLSKKIACDCKREKSVCVYLDFIKGKALKTSRYISDWDYVIDCSKQNRGKLIKSYDLHGRILKLYQREK